MPHHGLTSLEPGEKERKGTGKREVRNESGQKPFGNCSHGRVTRFKEKGNKKKCPERDG